MRADESYDDVFRYRRGFELTFLLILFYFIFFSDTLFFFARLWNFVASKITRKRELKSLFTQFVNVLGTR